MIKNIINYNRFVKFSVQSIPHISLSVRSHICHFFSFVCLLEIEIKSNVSFFLSLFFVSHFFVCVVLSLFVHRTVSKDRDSNDSASGTGLRFRNQSPSTTNRRSRDRERTTNDKTWERDADANTMLITNEANIASPAVAGTIGQQFTNAITSTTVTAPTGADQSDHPMEDSRLSGKPPCYVISSLAFRLHFINAIF